MSCKKWVKFVTIISISFIILLASFNFIVDSAKLFDNDDYLEKVAENLNNGHIVAGLKNYDERKLQEYVIKGLKKKVDVAVIGASTSLHIRQKLFPNQLFLNNSVSGAYIEDVIAILGIYQVEQKYIPKRVIIGVVPEMFVSRENNNRYKSIFKYYKFYINKLDLNLKENEYLIWLDKFKQLFSFEYTLENVRMLDKTGDNNFYLVKNTNIDDYIKEIDGSIHYPFKTLYKTAEDIKKISINSINDKFYGEVKSNILNVESFNKFQQMIKDLKGKDIKIEFFLAPFNPIIWEQLTANYKGIIYTEKILREFAKKENIKVYGSYNPQVFNLKNEDFYDSMHGKENVSFKIFRYRY